MKRCWCVHGGRIVEIWQRWENTKGLDNDVLQELASGWKQTVLSQVSCKGHRKDWLTIMERKKKCIGHQVMTLIESLNSCCANIGSGFYYDRKTVLLFIWGLNYFSYFSFVLLVTTNLNDWQTGKHCLPPNRLMWWIFHLFHEKNWLGLAWIGCFHKLRLCLIEINIIPLGYWSVLLTEVINWSHSL